VSATGRFEVNEAIARLTEVEGIFDDADGELEPSESRFETGGVRRGAELELVARIEDRQPTLFQAPEPMQREAAFKLVLWETGRGPIAQNVSSPSLPVATITPFSHRIQRLEVEALSEASFADLKPTVLELVRIFDPEIQDLEILKRPRSESVVYVRHGRLGRVPLSSFGDGMRRILLIGVTLATVRGGVLLVDEIESAIHTEALIPAFQWLQRACRDVDVQLFATTHSLEAVDALLATDDPNDDLVLYRLERHGGSTRAKRFARERLRVLREELGQEVRA
jgi:hypothetical protein